jgi:hypothetical protein
MPPALDRLDQHRAGVLGYSLFHCPQVTGGTYEAREDGPKPLRTFSCPVAAIVPRVRPWKEVVVVIMSVRPSP